MKYKFEDIIFNITEKKKPVEEDKYNYIGLEHLESGNLFISKWGSDTAPEGEKIVMKKGDILFGKRRAYQKKVAISPIDGIFSAHGMVLRPKEDVICKEFLPFFISSEAFLNEAIRISVGGLSPTVNWKDIKELEFDLPPLAEQKVLAEKLWAAYEVKQSYLKMIAATEEMVKSQFIEMFGDPITNPKGWPVMSMRESSRLLSDGPFGSNLKTEHYRDSGIRVIRLQNICLGYFDDTDKAYISVGHYEKLKKYTCRPGEIVIGTLGVPNFRACVIPTYIDVSINKADCVHYIPKSELLNNVFACAYINCKRTLQIATSNIHGTTRARIAAGQVNSIPIYIPPMDLQLQFVSITHQADKSISELRKSVDAIDKVIKSLINENL